MNEDEYYGSEKHFQDLQRAAGKSTADQRKNPETLGEAAQNIADDVGELLEAFGFFRLADRVLIALGRVLIKMGFGNDHRG